MTPKNTFNDLAFLPLSRPLINFMNLFVLDMLLIWEAAGEGMDPDIGPMLSKVLSIDCFITFGFFTVCCPYKP